MGTWNKSATQLSTLGWKVNCVMAAAIYLVQGTLLSMLDFSRLKNFLGQARRALQLVWATSPGLLLGLVLATLAAGILPALAAWLGQRIVDAVVAAMQLHQQTGAAPLWPVLRYVFWKPVCWRCWPRRNAASPCNRRCCVSSWGRRSIH